MVTIHFNYSGVVNGQPINGNAVLQCDPETGNLTANANFASFPDSFNPSLAGFSLVSISCSNSGKAMGSAKNIIDVTNGLYSSIREIELFDASSNFLGNIIINGTFTKVTETMYTANVTVTGNYSGPVNILFPDGYTLPLTAIGNYKLEGTFQKSYQIDGGSTILTENRHTYYFNNGVSTPIGNIECVLSYDTLTSYWLPVPKILHLLGSSIINPL